MFRSRNGKADFSGWVLYCEVEIPVGGKRSRFTDDECNSMNTFLEKWCSEQSQHLPRTLGIGHPLEDVRMAEHFAGKTWEEMRDLFKAPDGLKYAEDFVFLSREAILYYSVSLVSLLLNAKDEPCGELLFCAFESIFSERKRLQEEDLKFLAEFGKELRRRGTQIHLSPKNLIALDRRMRRLGKS